MVAPVEVVLVVPNATLIDIALLDPISFGQNANPTPLGVLW